ncbi:hypothetical protein ACFXGA_34490 [Actinosynnema sp. NPDC059335]|uniref:hypothetical protein n=1 Tax=Actinosynnema sp. NPDC059335 TaxID=3346804 RepID=UPI00366FFD84
MPVDDPARPRAVRGRLLRTVAATVLAAATAFGGTPARAQDAPATPPTETAAAIPETPTEPPAEQPAEPSTAPPAEQPAAPPAGNPVEPGDTAQTPAPAEPAAPTSPPAAEPPARDAVEHVGDTTAEAVDRGTATGVLLHYSEEYPGRPLAGVRLLALDSRGNVVAEWVSGSDGAWRFANLPVGEYDVLVPGPYRARDGGDRFRVPVVAGAPTSSVLAVVDGPVVEPPAFAPDVRVSASFDRSSYDIEDPVTATITLVNAGAVAAYARLESEWVENGFAYDPAQWGDLGAGLGDYLEPGEERTVTLVGNARSTRDGVVRMKGRIAVVGDADPTDNEFDLSAAVTHRTGDVVAVVYGDRDGDGAFDAGEALPNVTITFEGGLPPRSVTGVTGPDGTYRLEDAPAGVYAVRTTDEHTGWVSHVATELVVTGDRETTAHFRMERPLSDRLHASAAFDRETYARNDPVRITITLSNSGDAPVLAKAFCYGGISPAIHNGPAWGPLADGGPGVEVAPGETRVVTVHDSVPRRADDNGLFSVGCSFGPEYRVGLPSAFAVARVPGVTWVVFGRAVTGGGTRPPGIPGVELVLLDWITGKPVARTVTGPRGDYEFRDLPVGHYTPVLVGPWRFESVGGGIPYLPVRRGHARPLDLYFVPGPEVPDPGAPPTGPGDPDPGPPAGGPSGDGPTGGGAATGSDRLADTGAGVAGLGLAALLLLAAGVGTRTAGRRRTA